MPSRDKLTEFVAWCSGALTFADCFASSTSSSSSKVYDPKDANKNGTVFSKKETDYGLKHPNEAKPASNIIKLDGIRGEFEATA